ncbi:phage major capsid protein [Celeribacter indicus]|uniref:HK97 family phage major capsid protein n=1 Tax=Celeribacter indicus TaxID=1208324 RepID=A0A0B5E1B7_9RHOB|nr:phage major capsid protein [Celeribacter indicus]AJE47180.1 HK97 family phage major capsid protein [Celeribacter indicus]SDW00199.1 phage prohead protease, HK97 family/phage major capsid protein, HK97 family,TIGR01554 [Celeribacter indicus]
MDKIEVKANLSVDDEGSVTGVAWPFRSADRMGDVIERAAFANAVPPLPMLDTHDQTKAIGVWNEVAVTDEGLKLKGRLLVNDVERAREVRALVLAGGMRGLSIGFHATKALPRHGGGRTIQALELMEISIVAVPAHPGARITSAKGAEMAEQENGAPDVTALETKVGETTEAITVLTQRLDKVEAKANRPGGDQERKDDPSDERKAFANYLRHGDRISDEDRKALNVSSDPQGGYLAPPELSSEIIRDLVEYSPIRSVASVRTTTAPSVIYPTRGDVTNARWHGEMDERKGSDISFGQKELEPKEISTYVDISNRLLADAPQAEIEVRAALSEDFGQKEAKAFVNGAGGPEPEGFMAHPSIEHTVNGHATEIKADALIKLLYALPATYRNRGVWALNGTTLGLVRTMKDGQGNYLWQPSYQAGQPETILGRPVVEMVDMPDVEANAFPICYGDFSAYRIIDRLAVTTLVDPYTQATTGITRIHATRRTGGAVLQAARFRKLKMAAS